MKGSTEVTYKEIIFQVDYDFTPGRPGMWTLSNGDPGYPDEPDEMNIDAIRVMGIDVYDVLSQDTINQIEELVINKVNNN